MEELVTLSITQLEELMKKKLIAAGLPHTLRVAAGFDVADNEIVRQWSRKN